MTPVNETLAQYSELFMLIAALIYLVAFFFFSWDMATASRSIRNLEAELETEKSKELVGASGPPVEERVEAPHLVSDDMEYTGGIKRPAANIGVAIFVLAMLAHAFAVVARAVAASRAPWGNLYEFMTSGALVISLVYLVFLLRKDLRFVGTFISGVVLLMMIGATIGFPTPVGNVQPALQSWWLITHVSVAVVASGIFALTFSMSVLQLFKQRAEKRGAPTGFMRLVPSASALENWSYRLNAIGFVMWTFTLIAGAIWAEQAWGRYWNWDAKEVWTFVIWVIYAGYLHARATRGWTGTRSAWLNIIGFLALVFNYTIVNLYFPSLHSYAGF
ncbi:c-type cytochrome biogenesis protein CcsB [Yaniella flava]|uniref:C-type cytochrome biogenesis protein CcsB n=1 Tax=Yaniella flava TaxID=287930 RepID=A0ABP5G2J2_9MICC